MRQKTSSKDRGTKFAETLTTKITKETESEQNPFICDEIRIHGYEVFDLAKSINFSDLIFLLFSGEAPDERQSNLFRELCVIFCNPGLRHPAVQSSIVSAAAKTDPLDILPIALAISGGTIEGGGTVEACMRFLRKNSNKEGFFLKPKEDCALLVGSVYGTRDYYAKKLLGFLEKNDLPCLNFLAKLDDSIAGEDIGVTKASVFAAALADLPFPPRSGGMLWQLICAPALAAHGVEFMNKRINDFFFEDDEMYEET